MSKRTKNPSSASSAASASTAQPVLSLIKDIKRQTRRQYSAEEKIRIVLEGLRGENSIAEICRREQLNTNVYYRWSGPLPRWPPRGKEFLEAGKKRLTDDTLREADASQVRVIKSENEALKQLVAELSLENRQLKKRWPATAATRRRIEDRYRRMTASGATGAPVPPSEKMEIITLVEHSSRPVKATLQELGMNRSTFYKWYKQYLAQGYEGLANTPVVRRNYRNRLPDDQRHYVVELALDRPDLSCRELAWHIVDQQGWRRPLPFVSESTVYRILKSRGLITTPAFRLMEAADRYQNPTTAVHQLWQTDFTYFKIQGWGWYYLSTVIDDYSRFVISWQLCSSMQAVEVASTMQQALQVTGLPPTQRPRILTDNGSAYVSKYLKTYFEGQQLHHVRSAPYHPMTQAGRISMVQTSAGT